jgi:hypothetical protein
MSLLRSLTESVVKLLIRKVIDELKPFEFKVEASGSPVRTIEQSKEQKSNLSISSAAVSSELSLEAILSD